MIDGLANSPTPEEIVTVSTTDEEEGRLSDLRDRRPIVGLFREEYEIRF